MKNASYSFTNSRFGRRAADEIGKSFTFGNKLTQSEIDALERWRRGQEDDKELYPLQPKQRVSCEW